MVIKSLKDAKFSSAWAVSPKNSLRDIYTSTPNQLVFSHNPNWPNNLVNYSPVLHGMIT